MSGGGETTDPRVELKFITLGLRLRGCPPLDLSRLARDSGTFSDSLLLTAELMEPDELDDFQPFNIDLRMLVFSFSFSTGGRTAGADGKGCINGLGKFAGGGWGRLGEEAAGESGRGGCDGARRIGYGVS